MFDNRIVFREAFDDRYTLTIDTDVLAGSIPIQTTSEIRWNVRVQPLDKDRIHLDLITLHHELLKANNPNLQEMARLSQAFGRMYNELDLLIDNSGRVLHINNIEQIRRKWAHTKGELEAIDETSEAIKGIINLNDEIFTTEENMLKAVQENEFFTVYFQNIYGRNIPATISGIKKWNHFQQAQLDWAYYVAAAKPQYAQTAFDEIEITGTAVTAMSKDWIQKAYGSFQNIDQQLLQPRHTDTATYTIRRDTGKLMEAHWLREEVANPQFLFSRIAYHLISGEAEAHQATAEGNGQKQDVFVAN